MGDWIIGAFINIFGSIAINFGTNLLKLGHDQREKLSMLSNDGSNRLALKPIIYFHTWRVGILFFAFGNCLNFISFGYAAQSLLAALGSIQFVSNMAFSYFVLSKTVTVKVMIATTFIVFGNIFLVSFGNHQSPVFTPEQLTEKYGNLVFLLYCLILLLVVAVNHYIYRKGEGQISVSGPTLSAYWHMLLPFSYAVVSGAVGSCSVLFAKSLSNLLRLAMSSNYHLHSLFTYSMLLLFLSTAGFWVMDQIYSWTKSIHSVKCYSCRTFLFLLVLFFFSFVQMARLNEGLSLFDAILIVPMFQISWTFFSMCTGFVYFQEYQVFDTPRITMFLLGMSFVFIGISLLAPDDPKGGDLREPSLPSSLAQGITADMAWVGKQPMEEIESKDTKSFWQVLQAKTKAIMSKAKAAGSLSLGLGDESLNASSVLVMPMVSSRTTGFRGTIVDRTKFNPLKGSGWTSFSMYTIEDEDNVDMRDTSSLLPHSSSL